ncbi:MAG: hypothetical protein DHS20C03_07320 [Minwuia thermotolerans]|nr:MAG: hypothetical protein DHS20C03_07320 [Minwuia thermotolerans]
MVTLAVNPARKADGCVHVGAAQGTTGMGSKGVHQRKTICWNGSEKARRNEAPMNPLVKVDPPVQAPARAFLLARATDLL